MVTKFAIIIFPDISLFLNPIALLLDGQRVSFANYDFSCPKYTGTLKENKWRKQPVFMMLEQTGICLARKIAGNHFYIESVLFLI